MKVITTRNVYTGKIMDLCREHYDSSANGDTQVQHGLHAGACSACKRTAAAFALMDDELREQAKRIVVGDDQAFLECYCSLHEEKFGESFEAA